METDDSGWGRLFLDPAKQHDDLRLWGRAIRERWDIDDDFKKVILNRARKIIEHGESDKLALEAIDRVERLMAQNQKDEHKVIDVHVSTRHEDFPRIADDLGVDIAVIESVSREASSCSGDPEESPSATTE